MTHPSLNFQISNESVFKERYELVDVTIIGTPSPVPNRALDIQPDNDSLDEKLKEIEDEVEESDEDVKTASTVKKEEPNREFTDKGVRILRK